MHSLIKSKNILFVCLFVCFRSYSRIFHSFGDVRETRQKCASWYIFNTDLKNSYNPTLKICQYLYSLIESKTDLNRVHF